MEADVKLPLSHKRRSGSETRQKDLRVSFRVTAQDRGKVETAAAGAGLTVASYARAIVVDAPQTRARRRPLADVAALSGMHREWSRVGSNINQLLKRVNFGETPVGQEFREALDGLRELVAAARLAMGIER